MSTVETRLSTGGWRRAELRRCDLCDRLAVRCDLCDRLAVWMHPEGGWRCVQCPRPGDKTQRKPRATARRKP